MNFRRAVATVLVAIVTTTAVAKENSPKSATEGLTSAEIMAVIRANLNQIRHCYETLLQEQPGAAGKVDTSFAVAAKTGAVKFVAISPDSTIRNEQMHACIIAKMEAWKFPVPRGDKDVTVNYPFVFNPL